MNIDRIKRLLAQKESITLEFKEAKNALPTNLFETICAMLNRDGGDIFLGVADTGEIIGVEETAIETLKSNLVNLSNNPQKIDPPHILFPMVYEINNKQIIHIQVPASSQVHKTNAFVYDRSNDGDFKVMQAHRIAEIVNRKRVHYTENIIYQALGMDDLKNELFEKARNLMYSHHSNHPWLALTNEQMLQKAGLLRIDPQTKIKGLTLAAILLFGKDDVIQNVLPHYKIDALVRVENTNRYDDRLYIQTNLIDAYDQLLDFIAKHLPDKFYMEGDQRVSLRTKIFREIVANLIVHREYTNALPTTFTIFADRVETRNANNPHGEGTINPTNFQPFPKNPLLAKFFIQLGRVDELGSGIMNVNKLLSYYTKGKKPSFIEEASFKILIPLGNLLSAKGSTDDGIINSTISGPINDPINDPINGPINELITAAIGDTSDTIKEKLALLLLIISEYPNAKRDFFATQMDIPLTNIKRYLSILVQHNLIEYIGSNKTGGYQLTKSIAKKLKKK